MRTTTCETCIFFDIKTTNTEEKEGFCSINPPVIIVSGPMHDIKKAEWPLVKKGYWCGKWTGKSDGNTFLEARLNEV
jgi:hypothetical protein